MRAMPSPEPDESAQDKRINAFVAAARQRVNAGQTRVSELLAKHEGEPLIDTTLRTYHRDREVAGTVVGSAIAFRLFLFFVPLLLFLVGLAGFLANWIDAADVNEQAGLGGGLAAQIQTAFEQPDSTRWVAVVL